MGYELGSDAWVCALAQELNDSAGFRDAAKDWEASLVLIMRADPQLGVMLDRSVFLQLSRGKCRSARVAAAGDVTSARIILSGDASVWLQLLDQKLDPLAAVLQRRLHVERGNMPELMRHVSAARELINAAARSTASGRTLGPDGALS